MNSSLHITILAAATLAALSGCGAPTKSAGDVAHLFSGETDTLQNKVNGLCTTLNTRDLAPSFKLIGLDADGCRDAGRAALNLNSAEKFYFAGLEADGAGESDKNQIIHKSVRGQVWLNKSLIGLAAAFSEKLKAKSGGGNTGLLNIGGSDQTSGLSNIVKPEITMLEEPAFDLDAMKFSAKVHVKTTGAVEVDNEFHVDGELLDNSIVATLYTPTEQEFEKSLIHSLKAGVLVVPHASDVYLDIFFDLKVNSPGADGVVSGALDTFLSTGLKQIIDSLMTL
jgi:hypothetical protein